MQIATQTIALRALEPGDVDCLYLWENDAEMWRYGAVRAPYSRHQIWDYINNYDADPFHCGQLRLMITVGSQRAGVIDLYDIDSRNRNAFVGIMICPAMRRNGIGAKALAKLMQFCRTNLALNSLGAVAGADNTASNALFRHAGFSLAGTLPNWLWQHGGSFGDATLYIVQL